MSVIVSVISIPIVIISHRHHFSPHQSSAIVSKTLIGAYKINYDNHSRSEL